uniref:Secreted protein n=2 Tax=Ixodes ricinus TaxID=34613 RepID=V5ID94_IXORI
MRVLLLLPLCHLFRDPANHLATLVGKYCLCVTQLKPRPAAILERWWSLLGEAQFEDLVGIFKECIIYVLGRETPTKQNHGHLKLALDILSKLNHVNRDVGSLVSYEHFYIPAVDGEGGRAAGLHPVGSRRAGCQRTNKVYFCDYPFVFNAQAKTLILQTDSHNPDAASDGDGLASRPLPASFCPWFPRPTRTWCSTWDGKTIVNDTL